ncbi:SEC-C metal-binding domain-containing protein [Peribacillus sp. SCS-37]|uniref:SEC-C metal-binding domain-containing protein n=1 Tax=Paraperibacillus esterisolvens TaxID=3115296 RepID=UPI003905A998
MEKKYKKNLKPDQYAVHGALEIARFGNTVVLKNNMNEEEHRNYISRLSNDYLDTYKKIDAMVKDIRDLVSKCAPLHLLAHGYYGMFFSMLGKTSEFQHNFDDTVAVRMVDYIQSLIVSSAPQTEVESQEQEIIDELSIKVSELYRNLNYFHLTRSAYLKEHNPDYDYEYDTLYVQAQQLRTSVRGDRYPVHEISHFRDLLTPHNDVFVELFNLSMDEFLVGISKIQFSLTQGINQMMMDIEEIREKTLQAVEEKLSIKKYNEPAEAMNDVIEEKGLTDFKESIVNRFFGYDLFDVQKITGFPESLLKKLAWGPGEETDFFAPGEFAGWPLRRLPVEVRPFINIDNKYYCFDLYSLLDNLYRVIQRLIIHLKPNYKEEWNRKQKKTSEELPFRLFASLLTGAEIYKSIYYPSNTSNKGRKEWCENDGIIIYDDHLIVIEVKAGSFTYTPPSTDFSAHIQSIKTLIKSPSDQAKRFTDYLTSADSITIYDEQHKAIRTISKKDFRKVTICAITLDNFNSFAARSIKLTPLGLELNQVPVWSLAVDDLRVYLDYFDSPGIFLHFIEQRYEAANSEELELFDELDHLGMYIKHNQYVKTAKNSGGKKVIWEGYREDIDSYFGRLIIDGDKTKKPKQIIPTMIENIIKVLDYQAKKGRCRIVSSLMDLDGKTRHQLDGQIRTVLRKQSETKRFMPLSLFGETKITIVCKLEGITSFSSQEAEEYILATLLKAGDNERLGLYLNYNEGKLDDVSFSFFSKKNIPNERRQLIEEKSYEYAESRIASYKKQNGIRAIGRNVKCPCGSGKKYKKCCIK